MENYTLSDIKDVLILRCNFIMIFITVYNLNIALLLAEVVSLFDIVFKYCQFNRKIRVTIFKPIIYVSLNQPTKRLSRECPDHNHAFKPQTDHRPMAI